MPKIVIATDAWHPQVNGVITTITNTVKHLRGMGNEVQIIHPSLFKTYPNPIYPEIKLALFPRIWLPETPDHIHICTEGPVGLAMRKYCVKNGYNFTTSYHTNFDLYFFGFQKIIDKYLQWFHSKSSCIMVASDFIKEKINHYNNNIQFWSRGVDTRLFTPQKKFCGKQISIIYVGRVSKEKNIEEFLKLPKCFQKTVVGDGPLLSYYYNKYPEVNFTGYKYGEELANIIAKHDVFVFPSRTDTFGIVMLEALACGVPVAAHEEMGPLTVFEGKKITKFGALDEDLTYAIFKCVYHSDLVSCIKQAKKFSWKNTTQQFQKNLVKVK